MSRRFVSVSSGVPWMIDNNVLRDCKKITNNLDMLWIDYRKAYDMILHSWIYNLSTGRGYKPIEETGNMYLGILEMDKFMEKEIQKNVRRI